MIAPRVILVGCGLMVVVLVCAGCGLTPSPTSPWPATPAAGGDAVWLRAASEVGRLEMVQLEEVASDEPVLLTAMRPLAVDFFGKSVEMDVDTTLVLGVSPDTLYAVCLVGRARSDGVSVEPGELLLWTPLEPAPRSHPGDMAKFRETLDLNGAPVAEQALAALAETQASKLWWGLLRPTGLNAVSASPPGFHEARSVVLTEPAAVKARFGGSGEPGVAGRDAASVVASAISEALRAGDVVSLAAFLDPHLVRGANGPSNDARERLAAVVIDRHAGRFPDAAPTPITGSGASAERNPAFQLIDADGDAWRLTLTPGDGLFFFHALAPDPNNDWADDPDDAVTSTRPAENPS